MDALGAEHQAKSRRQVNALIGRGITSEAKLIKQFSSLSNSQRCTAAWLIGRLGRRFVPLMQEALEADRSEAVRAQAGTSLSMLGGKAALRGLLKLAAKPDLTLQTRQSVAYALSFLGEDGALEYLLVSFANKSEHPDVRAQCAEGIANLLSGADRRTRVWKQTVITLLPGLKDDSAEIRFWTIFAVGALRAKAALPTLRKLTRTDAAVMSSMGWEVGEEATDAIAWIEGRQLDEDAYTRSRKRRDHES